MMNQQICRCCLLENPRLTYNIFADDLHNELTQFAPHVKIAPEDGLPEVICDLCRIRLRDALDFRQRCEATDTELRRRYDDTNKTIDEVLGLGLGLRFLQTTDESLLPMDGLSVNPKAGELDNLLGESRLELPVDFGSLDFLLEDISLSSIQVEDTINELLTKDNYEPISQTLPPIDNIINCAYVHEEPVPTFPLVSPAPSEATQSTHDAKKSPKSAHPCPACEKSFTRNFQLKLHMISVHKMGDGLQYKCVDCQKNFASRHSLNYHHKSIHSAERPFACTECDRRFVLRTQLASHMRQHTGEVKPRIFSCAKCDKTWPTKSDLRTHMRTHDPEVERPFACDRCEKRFFTRGHLSSHVLVHTGQKPFECVFCQKSYQSIGNLNHHLVKRHKEQLLGDQGSAISALSSSGSRVSVS